VERMCVYCFKCGGYLFRVIFFSYAIFSSAKMKQTYRTFCTVENESIFQVLLPPISIYNVFISIRSFLKLISRFNLAFSYFFMTVVISFCVYIKIVNFLG